MVEDRISVLFSVVSLTDRPSYNISSNAGDTSAVSSACTDTIIVVELLVLNPIKMDSLVDKLKLVISN